MGFLKDKLSKFIGEIKKKSIKEKNEATSLRISTPPCPMMVDKTVFLCSVFRQS